MIYLLEIANSYVLRGSVRSIRCSTRPDYIDEEIVGILKKYNVCVVELGLQSVSDEVLEITKRNHSFSDEERACRLITEAGITLVGQMMIGLPGATIETELETARFIINAGAVAARVYPTVVFRDTELCSMSICGSYTPLSLDEAIERTAKVVSLFRRSDVKVIRVGLCSSDKLSAEDTYFAGPNHPALGELVENRIYYDVISDKLKEISLDSESVVEIYIPRGALSKAVGQKKRNKFLLIESFGIKDAVFIESDVLSSEEILIVKRKENKCT
jgi:histone acetyltransferase (RNA polymerase elongator complex component)